MKWTIDKQFDFCYGHRVHNQKLNEDYSLDPCLKCRHLHGHQGLLKIHLELLDGGIVSGMVTDFKHLNWMKKWIDDVLDHKFIIDRNDPVISSLFPLVAYTGEGLIGINLREETVEWHSEGYWTPNLSTLEFKILSLGCRELFEVYEGLVIVDFVPTSENLCAWIARIAYAKMEKLGVIVSKVEFNETPKSHCQVVL